VESRKIYPLSPDIGKEGYLLCLYRLLQDVPPEGEKALIGITLAGKGR